MTLWQVEELSQYWTDHPPVHLLVAAYLGVKPSSRPRLEAPAGPSSAAAPVTGDDPAAVAAALFASGGFGRGNIHAGLGKPTFDWEELKRMRPN